VAAIDGTALTLSAGSTTVPSVLPGDRWQGVYLFDSFELLGDQRFFSADPVRVTGDQVIAGQVTTREVVAGNLTLAAGTHLVHPPTAGSGSEESLTITLTGDLVLEDGATIDATGLGYKKEVTYPGETIPGPSGGGSHMGVGGAPAASAKGSTYGSLYRPQEPGAGGEWNAAPGGGVIRIQANSVTFSATSAILADASGASGQKGSAGGSIWITSPSITGPGLIAARGTTGESNEGGGGGGAIALEYSVLGSEVTVSSAGGPSKYNGGAGTIYKSGSASTYGDLGIFP